MNQQMYNKFKSSAIVTVIEVWRSEWLRLVRMGGERAVQKLVEGKPGGRGDRGRSRLTLILPRSRTGTR